MSSTNHTTNYNLPQFVGSDKPAWLGDVNPAMSAIDTQMKANADGVAGILSMLNLTSTSTKQATALVNVTGITSEGNLKLAQNADGSIFKFYNYVAFTNNTDESVMFPLTEIPGMSGLYGLKVLQLSQAPDEAYVINASGTYVWKGGTDSHLQDVNGANTAVGTDGFVYAFLNTSNAWGLAPRRSIKAYYNPCVYFNASFGDE